MLVEGLRFWCARALCNGGLTDQRWRELERSRVPPHYIPVSPPRLSLSDALCDFPSDSPSRPRACMRACALTPSLPPSSPSLSPPISIPLPPSPSLITFRLFANEATDLHNGGSRASPRGRGCNAGWFRCAKCRLVSAPQFRRRRRRKWGRGGGTFIQGKRSDE